MGEILLPVQIATGLKIPKSKLQRSRKELAHEGLVLRNDWIPALGTILARNDKTAEKVVEESKKKHDKMFELLMVRKCLFSLQQGPESE